MQTPTGHENQLFVSVNGCQVYNSLLVGKQHRGGPSRPRPNPSRLIYYFVPVYVLRYLFKRIIFLYWMTKKNNQFLGKDWLNATLGEEKMNNSDKCKVHWHVNCLAGTVIRVERNIWLYHLILWAAVQTKPTYFSFWNLIKRIALPHVLISQNMRILLAFSYSIYFGDIKRILLLVKLDFWTKGIYHISLCMLAKWLKRRNAMSFLDLRKEERVFAKLKSPFTRTVHQHHFYISFSIISRRIGWTSTWISSSYFRYFSKSTNSK